MPTPGSTRLEIPSAKARLPNGMPSSAIPRRKNRRSNLDDKSRGDNVSGCDAIHFSPLQLLKEASHDRRTVTSCTIAQKLDSATHANTRTSTTEFSAKAALPVGRVLVNQRLEAGIATQRIPDWIKL